MRNARVRVISGRGLAGALLLSILAHGLWLSSSAAWLPASQNSSATAAWATRFIQAEPATQSPDAVAVGKQQAAKALARSAPMPKAALEEPVLKQNTYLAPINIGPNAIENIANNVPQTQTLEPIDPPLSSESAMQSVPAEAAAAQAMLLQYPGNVTLAFDGVFARQGVQRKGAGQLQWKSDGAAYEMSLQASYLGIAVLSQNSAGGVSDRGLEPLRFGDRRGLRSEQAAHFRRDKSMVEFSNNKPSAALQPGAQDRLSVMLQLAGLLMGDIERHLSAKRIVLQVAGVDDAQVWEFVIEDTESVNLPAGQMQALRLQRKPRDEFDQRLEIWLAADLGYLPVRIKQTSVTSPDKDFTDLVLSKLP
jgi:Protein of unknown function (DUF3108)